METHRRKAGGRRVFTPQIKQNQVARLGRQELTASELARELAVRPELRQRCTLALHRHGQARSGNPRPNVGVALMDTAVSGREDSMLDLFGHFLMESV